MAHFLTCTPPPVSFYWYYNRFCLADSSIRYRCEDFHSVWHTSQSAVNFLSSASRLLAPLEVAHFKRLALQRQSHRRPEWNVLWLLVLHFIPLFPMRETCTTVIVAWPWCCDMNRIFSFQILNVIVNYCILWFITTTSPETEHCHYLLTFYSKLISF